MIAKNIIKQMRVQTNENIQGKHHFYRPNALIKTTPTFQTFTQWLHKNKSIIFFLQEKHKLISTINLQ